MFKYSVIVTVILSISLGCGTRSPIGPELEPSDGDLLQDLSYTDEGPYRLWGEWTWYINAEHDRVDVVPYRQGQFHLNALKFLESYCTDCLKILGISNNGDGTVDILVRISHPFTGHPEYTAFDVKGILMFEGSYLYTCYSNYEPPGPDPYRISWRLMGDPELMNPDGYTWRWSPTYESGSGLPMFNYLPGKYSMGTPTANLNGFRNFYTHEERHMFSTNGVVQRVYTVWLPPGEPVVVGYAVEACWELPINTPVTDPLNDFPITANQPEPYLFNVVVNNDEPITEAPCCGETFQDCSDLWVECASWEGIVTGFGGNTYIYWLYADGDYHGVGSLFKCSPTQEDTYYVTGQHFTDWYENGTYRELIRFCEPPTGYKKNVVIDIYDFTIALED